MALVRWKNHGELAPWSALRELEKEFNRFWGGAIQAPDWFEGAWVPSVDVTETDDAYVIEADLPGLSKDDIELVIVDNVITLKGERRNEHEEKAKGYHRFERYYGGFQRSFEIPGGFNGDKVTAQMSNGVLQVTVPKREEAKPKQIQVQVQ